MAYPYTNDEIQEVADTISELLYGWLTNGISSEMSYSTCWNMIRAWNDQNIFWDPWCLKAEQYSPITKGRGICRDMLSPEQRAIVSSSVKQTVARASQFLEESPKFEKYREEISKRFENIFEVRKSTAADRDWDLERRLKNIRNHEF